MGLFCLRQLHPQLIILFDFKQVQIHKSVWMRSYLMKWLHSRCRAEQVSIALF